MKTAYFRFGQLRQERGDKHVRAGELVLATNVRQTSKAGVYQKRRGFGMTSLAFSGATWGAATPVSVVTGKDGQGILMRDSLNRLWSYDASAVSPTWTYRGTQDRAWADSQVASSFPYSTPQLCSVEVGTNTWTFARKGARTVGGTVRTSYDLLVTDSATGTIVSSQLDINGGGGWSGGDSGMYNMACCYDGTYVWMFFVTRQGYSDNKVMCHKFTAASPGNAPAETTYYTAAGPMNHVACFYHQSAGVIVAFCGLYAGTARLYHSILNSGTGVAKVSPAPQLVVNASTTLPIQALGFHGNQSTSGTEVYYHYHGFQTGGSGATYSGPTVVKITNLSTLAYSVASHTSEVGATTEVVVASGAVIGANEFVMWSKNGGFLALTKTASGVGTTWLGWALSYTGCWLASSLVVSGTDVYFLTGHDDVADSALPTGTAALAEALSTQRTLHLRKFAAADMLTACSPSYLPPPSWGWKIISQAFNGNASGMYHNCTATPLMFYRTGTTATLAACRIPDMHVSGSKFLVPVSAYNGVTGKVGVYISVFDTAKQWGSDCANQGKAIGPGSIPVVWSKDDSVHEIAPLMAPPYIRMTSAGTGTTHNSFAAVYRITDADGTVYRSAPFVLQGAFGDGAQFSVPYMRHMLPGTTVNVEIYVGTSANPTLQMIAPMSDGYYSGGGYLHEYAYGFAAASYVTGEMLYTVGGGLSQAPPPQCQTAGYWRNRVFLASKNAIWYSQEFTEGFGPLFNEVMRSVWGESLTDINIIRAVDWNYLALLSSDGIGIIDGPGPDGKGSGAYMIRTLSTHAGSLRTTASVSGINGCYFQDCNTGRLMTVTPQLQATECAGGAYDYAAESIVAASYDESERLLSFYTSSNKILLIDYQHPTESAPFGQVYMWTTTVQSCAAGKDSTGSFYVDSGARLYRPGVTFRDTDANGTATDYRMLIKTAQLQVEDLQGSFDVSRVQVLGKYNAACSVKLTTFPDYAVAGNATTPTAFSAAPLQLSTRPPSCMRIQSLALQVEETAGTGAAFDFEGFAVEYLSRGRMKTLNTSQVVS